MTQSYKQPGSTLTLTAPYDRASSGLGAMVGSIFGVTTDTVANGAEGEFETEGVHELLKTAAQEWTQGEKIYWNGATKLCDNVATVGPQIGVAVAGAANPSSTGQVKLLGNAPSASEGPQAAEPDAAAATATAPSAIGAYSALANLTDPVTKAEGEALSTQLAAQRESLEDLRAKLAAEIIDVAAIRVTLNSLLAKLRITGQIAP